MMTRYNTPATLEKDIGGTPDDEGHAAENWQVQGKAWGVLRQISTTEEIVNEQKRASAAYTFETHYRRDLPVDETWRLTINGRQFYLAGLPNNVDQLNRTWIFVLRESP
jgi:SPP1 family predicted phage head-tail adaptor